MRLSRIFCVALMGLGLALIALSAVVSPTPMLLYNPTPSAPIGWYKVDPNAPIEREIWVASYLPMEAERLADRRGYLPRGAPVIKPLAGVSGDRFCVQSEALVLHGERFEIQPNDRSGRELPRLNEGCRTVAEGHVLLLSNRLQNSFDSRYFGQVPLSLVIGEAVYLGVDTSGIDGEKGGARALGAQGKIKEPGAAGGLAPCLHIDFDGAARNGPALPVVCFLRKIRPIAQRQFTILHASSSLSSPSDG